MTILMLILSFLTVFVGSLMILIAAFRTSILWGLAHLFIPFAAWVFLIRYWNEAKSGVLITVIGLIALLGTVAAMPETCKNFEHGFRGAFEKARDLSDPVNGKIEKLTAQIQEQRDKILKLEGEFSQTCAVLGEKYKEITVKRQSLNSNDSASVVKFNEEATAYQKLNEQAKEMARSLETARQGLNDLLADRAKHMAASRPKAPLESGILPRLQTAQIPKKVVIYTTIDCPYCEQAKHYLTHKGVGYQELNVDSSSAASEEFKRLGGNGTPLILIGDRRITGFNTRAIDEALK